MRTEIRNVDECCARLLGAFDRLEHLTIWSIFCEPSLSNQMPRILERCYLHRRMEDQNTEDQSKGKQNGGPKYEEPKC